MYGNAVHSKDGISNLWGTDSIINGVRITGYPSLGKKVKALLKTSHRNKFQVDKRFKHKNQNYLTMKRKYGRIYF